MKEYNTPWKEREDNEILFSRVVKAGKRVYYIDVKSDRRDEYYISMTESKRVKDGTPTDPPVFEKHKLFLYREDILKFLTALTDAAQFVGDHRSLAAHSPTTDDYDYVPVDLPRNATLGDGFDIEF